MGKKYKNWCDNLHTKSESQFDTGDLCERLVSKLTDWVVHDFTIYDGMTQGQVILQRERMKNILDIAETIESLVNDANSIYALYGIDYQERRIRFMRARGLCFQLQTRLRHIVNYVHKDTNVQKYISLNSEIDVISNKIKNIMVSDDKKRKTKEKPYE